MPPFGNSRTYSLLGLAGSEITIAIEGDDDKNRSLISDRHFLRLPQLHAAAVLGDELDTDLSCFKVNSRKPARDRSRRQSKTKVTPRNLGGKHLTLFYRPNFLRLHPER